MSCFIGQNTSLHQNHNLKKRARKLYGPFKPVIHINNKRALDHKKCKVSEFLHTALLLPPTLNPILTRELVYTGITRAREWLTVVEAKRGVLSEVVRVSGAGG